MPSHRRAAGGEGTRRRTAAGLLAMGALAGTLLTVGLHPAAPPAPDREPATGTLVPALDSASSGAWTP